MQKGSQPPWDIHLLVPNICIVAIAICNEHVEDDLFGVDLYVNDSLDVLP